ncbi:MBL fold metallo-hydrolase RNA specificity domain-containing protein [Teredinibacter haidensis]|uniref:MBL fold metallo-hydrolase RNA specificity domain-containing protein n=1 Tax=Teredinibacter haidensis TaxID=2731755 RepID=UPI000948AB0F|nr:MBL fold metallo-hydrolase [Teredinibacter haidensis]
MLRSEHSSFPVIAHHGATSGVTGSCHRYMATDDSHYLIDCGLFQGEDEQGDSFTRHTIEFDISQVKGLIVTHVHIDHVGRLPYLLAAGFSGPIYCSKPSAHLLPLVIEDALKIGFTRDKSLINRFLKSVGKQLVPLDYGSWFDPPGDDGCWLRLKLQRAGHILGSAFVELDARYPGYSHRTVFSGDLGAPYAPLLPAPRSPYKADTLVIESTYGDKCHESRRVRKQHLRAAIEHALANGSTVMIPAFSIGRTQELLYELEDLIYRGNALWKNLEIIVDSPLAAKFTEVYKALRPYWDAEAQRKVSAGRHPLSFENLTLVDSHAEHQQTVAYLAKNGRPAVVLAASGMASGGRILNYLKAMLEDKRHAVLFVGYQARGTYGHTIQKYGSQEEAKPEGWVDIEGKRYKIRARVTTIGGYSAHADQKDLLNFVKRMRHWPSEIRIVHGDKPAKLALKRLYSDLGKSRGHLFDTLLPT